MTLRLRIGILDLIANKPTRSPYATLMNPNFASIMPQAVGVWCEELGHEVRYVTFTGREDLRRELPDDLDLLFVCAFTSAAYLAYCISNLYRGRGVVTVLGGPHARAYARDAAAYFDYVVGFADRALIANLLQGFSAHSEGGVRLCANKQPAALPGVRERWKFVRDNLEKASYYGCVPMVGSLGCPYHCDFCVDSQVPYQTLPYDQLREDLTFLLEKLSHPLVGWHDPNFGVRFDEYMEIIELSVPRGAMSFVAESSLSLLRERNLERLRQNSFRGIIVGIESWFGFNEKARQGRATGRSKVEAIAAQIRCITRYIPYTQANFVVGLDHDAGEEPFELTKLFLDLAAAAYPAYSLFTAFGDSLPLTRQLEREGRVLDAPFPLLDCASVHNVIPKNYSLLTFYEHLVDLLGDSYSPRRTWERFRANGHPISSPQRWMVGIRSVTSMARTNYYRTIRDLLARDTEFRAFCGGETTVLPRFFRRRIASELGPYYVHLPTPLQRPLEEHRAGGPVGGSPTKA